MVEEFYVSDLYGEQVIEYMEASHFAENLYVKDLVENRTWSLMSFA